MKNVKGPFSLSLRITSVLVGCAAWSVVSAQELPRRQTPVRVSELEEVALNAVEKEELRLADETAKLQEQKKRLLFQVAKAHGIDMTQGAGNSVGWGSQTLPDGSKVRVLVLESPAPVTSESKP